MPEKLGEEEKRMALWMINDRYASSFAAQSMLLKKEEKDGEKIFIYSGGGLPNIPFEWIGMHLATISGDDVYLSIEGAQLVGKTAKKNVVEITREDADNLMKGEDLKYDGGLRGNVIVKQGQNILGVCKAQEGSIINTIPRSRRTVRYKKK